MSLLSAPRTRRLANTISMVLASHTVQVTIEAKARPINTAFTTGSALRYMPHGLRSRGSVAVARTLSCASAGAGAASHASIAAARNEAALTHPPGAGFAPVHAFAKVPSPSPSCAPILVTSTQLAWCYNVISSSCGDQPVGRGGWRWRESDCSGTHRLRSAACSSRAGAMRLAVASDIDSPGVVYRHCSSNGSHVASNTWFNIEDF